VAVSCEHVSELPGFIKDGEFLDWSSYYEVLKKGFQT
jgi:hypothetical protein